MNMGIVTSFIVGGLLLLALLQFNNQVLRESTEVTLDINDNNHVETLRKIISRDFNRMGFGKNSDIDKFNPPHHIKFSADVFDEGTTQISWKFQENTPIPGTSNPNDRLLKRNGPVDDTGTGKDTRFHIVDFSITAYEDIRGENETTTKDEIRSLTVKIVYESPESVTSDPSNTSYQRSVWEKHFVPNNLQFKSYN